MANEQPLAIEFGVGVMTVGNQVAEASGKYLVEAAGQVVPTGYKQTEVGVIPEDWGLSDIASISLIPMQNGLFYEPKRKGKGIPLINVGDMYQSAPIDVTTLDLFEATANEVKVFKVQVGDLFFTRSSVVPTGIAYCNIFSEEAIDAVFDSHLIRVRPDPELMDARYLYLNCIANHARKFLISSAKTATMTTIDQGAIKKCPVLLPPREEQTAIANTLSDVDALINELEKLIAKKQAIKTATLQQLLTGRTRLPPFALREDGTQKGYKQSELGRIPEDWEVVELGRIAQLYQPETISSNKLKSDGYPVYGANGVIGFFDRYNHSDPQVIVTCRGSTCGTVNFTKGAAWITGNAMVVDIESIAVIDKQFSYYLLSFQDLTECITGSGQPQIVRGPLSAYKVVITKSKQEQIAIANILSDMDADIQTLQQRLSKTRQIKQGMMQELLTGKTRLLPKKSEVGHAC